MNKALLSYIHIYTYIYIFIRKEVFNTRFEVLLYNIYYDIYVYIC